MTDLEKPENLESPEKSLSQQIYSQCVQQLTQILGVESVTLCQEQDQDSIDVFIRGADRSQIPSVVRTNQGQLRTRILDLVAYDAAKTVMEAYADWLFSIPGVNGVSLHWDDDTGTPTIPVYLENEASQHLIPMILAYQNVSVPVRTYVIGAIRL